MANVTWKLANVKGTEPGDEAMLVRLTASHVSEEFAEHHILYEAEVFVPAGLTNLKDIEREAYARLRRYLPELVRALPPG